MDMNKENTKICRQGDKGERGPIINVDGKNFTGALIEGPPGPVGPAGKKRDTLKRDALPATLHHCQIRQSFIYFSNVNMID